MCLQQATASSPLQRGSTHAALVVCVPQRAAHDGVYRIIKLSYMLTPRYMGEMSRGSGS